VKHFGTYLAHFGGDEAATMVEFAVSLPLLLVLVVGIYDFGAAFNLKQELNNAVREGARYGASSSTTDLSQQSGATPPTVVATAILVDSYLQTARINDCGLNTVVNSTTTSASFTPPLIWTYTASGCSYGNLTLTIQRGYSKAATVASTNLIVIYTQVSVQYPYQWQFNRVIQLLVSGSSYAGTSLISTSATVPNVF
jgi:Flp pilus assembly protein TadG